ncbi:MAG: hypothetical protein IJG50_01600 [Clostridia bacterium]|nr:hypothetical protein [Clostridia bacterium]
MEQNCCYCGRPIPDNEYGAVRLKDGQIVCRDCADKTRILYPFRYTYVLKKGEIASGWTRKNEAIYDNTIQGQRIDPLREMTLEEFRTAMEESLKAAEAQAARYADAKAVIEVDYVRRYFANIGTREKPKYSKRKRFGVFGKVVHGELITGAEVVVSHKDKEYFAKIEELQDWVGTYAAGAPVGKASAGKPVIMMFGQGMDFVYPGDKMIVR